MLPMHILACVAVIPSLVNAEQYYLGGCAANFDDYLHPIAFTQQRMNILAEFGSQTPAKVYLWSPMNVEKAFTDMTLTMSASGYQLSFKRLGQNEQLSGPSEFVDAPTILKTTTQGNAENIWGITQSGIGNWYPVYLSPTDLIFRACRPALFGRYVSFYMLTNQNYSSLDPACAIQKVKEKTGWTLSLHNHTI